MKALSDDRWQEIRDMNCIDTNEDEFQDGLEEVLQQHDHLDAQIKLLADYIMSKRSDDPAWSLGEGACAMAVEIMRREKDIEASYKGAKWMHEQGDIAYKALQEHKNALAKENKELKERCRHLSMQ